MSRELLRNGFLLLPATVNPGGQKQDPFRTHFLWQTGRRPLPGLPCPAPLRVLHASPVAAQLRALVLASLPKVGLFQKADLGWHLANPAAPSIQESLTSQPLELPSSRGLPLLAAAAAAPRSSLSRPCKLLPAAFRLSSSTPSSFAFVFISINPPPPTKLLLPVVYLHYKTYALTIFILSPAFSVRPSVILIVVKAQTSKRPGLPKFTQTRFGKIR
jgi:hypothetical protein